MTLRISFFIPLLLVVSTIASSLLIYLDAKGTAEERIRKETLSRVNLDITRLENILYNILTERENGLEDAKLNLSVTAMDPVIKILSLVDENNNIILSNRYSLEGVNATQALKGFDQFIAQKIKLQNTPDVKFLDTDDNVLHGYYPIVLKLESSVGLPTKKVGVLFMEVNIKNKLAVAFNAVATQSIEFAIVMLLVSLLVAALLHKLISRRLALLSKASRQLAAGELDVQVNLKGRDELALLGKAFDDMALQIRNDIHHRIAAETELREFNETLEQRVFERTELLHKAQSIGHIGNWNWNVSTDELYWSDEIFRIFGYQANELKPSYIEFMSILHSDGIDKIKNSEEMAFSNSEGESYSLDHRILLPNGEERWVHEEVVAEFSGEGKGVKLSGTIQDITERKLIENNLRAAKNEAERLSEAKSDFLSRMSHELRTPMNAILGFSQLLNMQPLTEKQHTSVDEIETAGKHLLALITDLLDLSRIEAGRTLVVLESVNLNEVLSEAAKITESLILENNLSLSINCEADYKVIADVIRLRQVFVNLLSNASKYNNKGKTIKVTCSVQDDVIKVMVTDEGVGIDSEMINKLFIPFERLGAEFTGVDGTGIGLALSKQLIEHMSGKIGVESTPGQGSTFWVEIPRAKQRHIHADNINNPLDGEHICNILYIEDNIANLRVVEQMIEYFDQLKLMSAQNGNYGIELAKEYKPDLILLDINLPDINGYQVLNVLRDNKITKDIPIIAISADAMPINIERGLEAGFNDFLAKPIELNILIEALNKFINCNKLVSNGDYNV